MSDETTTISKQLAVANDMADIAVNLLQDVLGIGVPNDFKDTKIYHPGTLSYVQDKLLTLDASLRDIIRYATEINRKL